MTSGRLVIRAAHPDELPHIGASLARIFGVPSPAWAERRSRMPNFHAGMHRIGLLDDRIVAHVQVEPYTLRYGSARLQVAGIGQIYTEPAYRRNGYSGAVVRDALTYAVEQGAHIALLNGIRGYYTRFGFTPVFPVYEAAFDSSEIASLPCALTVRSPQYEDIPSMAALFERHWGGRVNFTRSAESWLWRILYPDPRLQITVVGPIGAVQGYMVGPDPSQGLEVIVNTPEAALSLLSHCGQWSDRAVSWQIPPDDTIIAFAQQIVPIRLSAHYQPDGGWMARLLDLGAMIDALLPELFAQVRVTHPRLGRDTLIITPYAKGIEIGLRGQRATFSLLSQRDFIQVLFGSLSPVTLGLRSGLAPESVALLQALFPPRIAAIAGWDWF